MPSLPSFDIYTRPGCSYCIDAKSLLTSLDLQYVEHSVVDGTQADGASAMSGQASVPQIFLGHYHIGGAEDLAALETAGRLGQIVGAMSTDASVVLPKASNVSGDGRDIVFADAMTRSDGARDDDPESWPILHFYKSFFGFWPNTFAYLHHWRDAYKLFVYCHNFAAIRGAREVLGPSLMATIGFATSNAQGCSYCQAHTAAWGGDQSAAAVRKALSGVGRDAGDDRARFEAALSRLAARAARNTVSEEGIKQVYRTGGTSGLTAKEIDRYIMATALIVAALGFLNVFNDLVGVEIEGDWADQAKQVGIEAGRHAVGDGNPDNLSYDLPRGGPSLEDMLGRYAADVGQPDVYLMDRLGVVPGWMASWAADTGAFHARLYAGLMTGPARFTAEQRHLMARVFALAKGAGDQALDEAAMAIIAGGGTDKAAARAIGCIDAATGRAEVGDLFDSREKAAFKVAWLAAQIPLTTPRSWIRPALEIFDTEELVQVFSICGLASLVQRFCAIRPYETAGDVVALTERFGVAADTLVARFPIPGKTGERIDG